MKRRGKEVFIGVESGQGLGVVVAIEGSISSHFSKGEGINSAF